MLSIGIWRFGLIGPFFFDDLPIDDTVKDSSSCKGKKRGIDHNKYLQLLKLRYLPEIEEQLPLDDVNVKITFGFNWMVPPSTRQNLQKNIWKKLSHQDGLETKAI